MEIKATDILLAAGVAGIVYYLATRDNSKLLKEIKSTQQALSNQQAYVDTRFDEYEGSLDPLASAIKFTKFAGLIADHRSGDKYISYYYWVKVKNTYNQPLSLYVSKCNVSLFGEKQLKHFDIDEAIEIKAGQERWICINGGNTDIVYPSGTINKNLKSLYNETVNVTTTDFDVTLEYNISSITTTLHTDNLIARLDAGNIYFAISMAEMINDRGYSYLKNKGLID